MNDPETQIPDEDPSELILREAAEIIHLAAQDKKLLPPAVPLPQQRQPLK